MAQLTKRFTTQQYLENNQNTLVVYTWNFKPEIYVGPMVEDWQYAFPTYIRPEVTFGVWNGPATVASPGFRTIIEPDPLNPQFGVWALASTSEEAVQKMIDNRDLVPEGYFYRISDRLPSANQMLSARGQNGNPLLFGPGFWNAYYRSHPSEDPKQKVAAVQAARAAVEALQAVELTVYNNGTAIWCAKTPEDSSDSMGPHPGVSILDGGVWAQASGGKAPADYNMPLPFVTRDQGSVTTRVAQIEWQTISAAAQSGSSWKAAAALHYFGLGPDPGPPVAHHNPVLDFFGL